MERSSSIKWNKQGKGGFWSFYGNKLYDITFVTNKKDAEAYTNSQNTVTPPTSGWVVKKYGKGPAPKIRTISAKDVEKIDKAIKTQTIKENTANAKYLKEIEEKGRPAREIEKAKEDK